MDIFGSSVISRRPRRPGFPIALLPSSDSCYVCQKFAHQPQRSWIKKEHPDDNEDKNEGFKDPGRLRSPDSHRNKRSVRVIY